jgi:hypothetical protein
MAGSVRYVEAEYTSAYIDQAMSWTITDSAVFPVTSVAKITAIIGTSGWSAGIVPAADIYSNLVGDNWQSGYGFGYTRVTGQPFDGGQVPPYYIPQRFPPLGGIELIGAGGQMNWTVRVSVHPNPGAIAWNGFIHAIVERYPISGSTTPS